MPEKWLKLVQEDPWLEPSENHIFARFQRFRDRYEEIRHNYGSLREFANAHNYLGFQYNDKKRGWYYREWAPAAHALFLTGDFINWERHALPMRKNQFGIWEIFIADDNPNVTLNHGDNVKVVIQSDLGEQLKIPAYIRRAVQDEESKNFTGQLWSSGDFDWEGDRFIEEDKDNLCIYECHIGMAQEKEGVGTFDEFRINILPRIKEAGYNAIQLMAIQEHPYYGSFGYHVSNFFAVSSRYGTPDELKALIREAHKSGIAVILDIVHSHTVKNTEEGLNLFDGSDSQYFHPGERGEHPEWDSMLFDYGKMEVLQFLLSNLRFWLEEYHFDGFRFDGVGSMMYFHHGLDTIDSQDKYFVEGVEWDAITYLQLANTLVHELKEETITIAEDVSGMPGLTYPVEEGGIGFDFRLGMGIPDFWIKMLKEKMDEDWNIHEMWNVLNDRLSYVKTISYAESHDQALVGDKTIAFRLMDKEMYWHMHKDDPDLVIERGIALHKMIRLFTFSLGGDAYMNFMGNEFGHPEWIDFPREGNNWSYKYCRRQWSLVDNEELKYQFLNQFDKEMIHLMRKEKILSSGYANQLNMDEENNILIFERRSLIFIFNFHPINSIPDYSFNINEAGEYEMILNSDDEKFGGHGRIDPNVIYSSIKNENQNTLKLYITNRSCFILKKIQ